MQQPVLTITHAGMKDIARLAEMEKICFPPREAASEDTLAERVRTFPQHFYLLWEDGTLVSFINGFVSDWEVLTDAMFSHPHMHRENGDWQMLFGVNTLPEKRGKGYASRLIRRMQQDTAAQGRKGIILTCKAHRIPFYRRLGFVMDGISSSAHGGALWYQMTWRCDTAGGESFE